jgi:uncharacterized membrane-anchored protein
VDEDDWTWEIRAANGNLVATFPRSHNRRADDRNYARIACNERPAMLSRIAELEAEVEQLAKALYQAGGDNAQALLTVARVEALRYRLEHALTCPKDEATRQVLEAVVSDLGKAMKGP